MEKVSTKRLLRVSSSVSAAHPVEFSDGRFCTSRRRCCWFACRVAVLGDASLHKS